MNFPTAKHSQYIEYMTSFCNHHRLSLILEGSLAQGKAKPYSDIDLILFGNVDANLLDDIICGYDNIVMTNFTKNPQGICILYYENGISVDLDIRDSILDREFHDNMVLCNYGFNISNKIIRKAITSKYICERPQWYQTIRLIHRCCIKYLCEKTVAADGLADEVCAAVKDLTHQEIPESDSIKQRMIASLYCLNKNYCIQDDILELMERLFADMD